jgi:3-hydroxyisobutyrate dehydrogenase-like beta-hydroxyacid dehydrogenase
MAFKKIGIMSIGEMGFHWAKLLKSHGVEVLTYDKDRGEVSRKRAENAGVMSLPSMTALVREAELIVSIVVPFAAKRVAAKVAKAALKAGRQDLLFLDANAISPMTADDISKTLVPAGVKFVDGCIIGAAAKMGKGSIVYVSGPDAARLRDLESFNIPIKVLGPSTNQASAFKVVYAGLTKGLQGLFCELLMGARHFGLLDEIRAQYEASFPGLLDKVSSSVVALRIHAARRAEEMDELKRTFSHHGMKSFMAPAVQKVLEAIAALNAGQPSADGARP